MKKITLDLYMTFDPNVADYWVGQRVTLPPIDTCAEDWGMTKKEFKKIKSQEGKEVIITSVMSGEIAQEAYYNIRTQDGYEFDMNFNIYPIEMALKFDFAGTDHFGEIIPLEEHPHY